MRPCSDHDRAHRVRFARRRVGAIERDARPNQIVMRLPAEENARRVRERSRDAGKACAHRGEALHLDRVERMIFFRAGEVAHHQRDAVIARACRRELPDLLGGKSKPVHAGIDMERGAAAPSALRAKRVPLVPARPIADHRPQVCLCKCRRGAGQDAVEHIDRRVGRNLARAARLGQVRDEEGPAPRFRQRARDLLDAAAVAVGLHHRGALRRRGTRSERAPVRR